jgi:hypothetical protein
LLSPDRRDEEKTKKDAAGEHSPILRADARQIQLNSIAFGGGVFLR